MQNSMAPSLLDERAPATPNSPAMLVTVPCRPASIGFPNQEGQWLWMPNCLYAAVLPKPID